MSRTASRADLTAAMQAAAAYLRSAADRAERGEPVDPVTARRSAAALDELAVLDAPPPEPIVARLSDGVTHHPEGTTVRLVDADDRLRGIALELDLEQREALGLSLVDPDAQMDQADSMDGFVDDSGLDDELGPDLDAGQYDEPEPEPDACCFVQRGELAYICPTCSTVLDTVAAVAHPCGNCQASAGQPCGTECQPTPEG